MHSLSLTVIHILSILPRYLILLQNPQRSGPMVSSHSRRSVNASWVRAFSHEQLDALQS